MSKVVVAMSGGVDSSVAAALLKSQGHDIIGMMLRLWSEDGREDTNRCCTPEAVSLARRVAAKLDIPFYVIDAKQVFRDTVVTYFLDGYARGETPNPCLVCNRQIRWTFLLEHALAFGADAMATGHYARLEKQAGGTIRLRRAIDAAKDQSYVLHVLDQQKLARAMFPVGEYSKPEVRRMAESFGLPTAQRHDSQDLCFLAGDDYRNFIQRHAPDILTPGPIRNTEGAVLGEHSGLANYTIGQRKGIVIASGEPLYVLGKDSTANTLLVGRREQLGSQELLADEMNWIGDPPESPFRAAVKIRYTAKEAPAVVELLEVGRRARIRFDAPQRDITAGQAAVFYDGDIVLGGGVIRSQHS
ncbi:MAG TPA: tRNA 2-thiouridine(34) synthase MnmA [Anaerolineales bacterium]|nr:tRNA 2-thiouridine(34) synthase MnmA [Anaerolineales bacterium]